MSAQLALDAGAAALLDALHAAGYAAYAVGGCVRDSLLGLAPHDWDLCTSALPQQVMALFGEENCIPTGLQHGTVTVKRAGALYEITTFRTEGTYTDGRHPDEVHFVPDVREDLARRDFTINAMAYSAEDGLVDPFGGQQDLKNGIVRAVGVPHQRFEEDALRILRLYRFAARFGFAIDPPTARAAEELCAHLDCVSAERIEEELAKLLTANAPAAYLDEKILEVIIPELTQEALAQAKPVVDACPAGAEHLPVRWAALLMTLGEAGARAVLKRLRCSNALIEETAVLVREEERSTGSFLLGQPGTQVPPQCCAPGPHLPEVLGETSSTPTRTLYTRCLLGRYDLKTVRRLAALGTAIHPERAADLAAMVKLAEQMEADGVCCRISQLMVNGRDLMAAGIPAGPGIRKALETLLDGVMREEYPNDRQTLLAQARKISAS